MDFSELGRFAALPEEFNGEVMADIEATLDEYDDYVSDAVSLIEELGGETGYSKPEVYEMAVSAIKYRGYDGKVERKFIAVLERMRGQYCKQEGF